MLTNSFLFVSRKYVCVLLNHFVAYLHLMCVCVCVLLLIADSQFTKLKNFYFVEMERERERALNYQFNWPETNKHPIFQIFTNVLTQKRMNLGANICRTANGIDKTIANLSDPKSQNENTHTIAIERRATKVKQTIFVVQMWTSRLNIFARFYLLFHLI